ncbi:MAG: four helix bundle protein [Candidatus Cloacimonas sp.]|nr:four helix bundle protein [Candidatus Cloacimonas sp.]
MSSFRDLKLWQVSMNLVTDIYRATESFPKNEAYGLTSQIRRCAVSVPSNIAESSSRNNYKEFIQFLYIANGSLSEFETQLEIAVRLKYIPDIDQFSENLKLIRSMLSGLINSLKENQPVRDRN